MTVQNSTTLKGYFETGDRPTQAQFGDLVDTVILGVPLAGGTSTGAANTYNFSVDSDLTAMAVGQEFSVIAHQTNSGACTSSINSITPLSITKNGATALAAGDVTSGAAMKLYYDGGRLQLTNPSTSSSTGTVASVALSMPAEFSVAGSPITSSGTLAVTRTTQTANQVQAGPASGVPALPTFRALVAADLPAATTAAQGAVQLATAAVTKTATDTVMPAAVGTLVNHPGIAKAWASVTGSTGAILASSGISGIVRNSTGRYTVTLSPALGDANYVVVGNIKSTGTLILFYLPSGGTKTTNTFQCATDVTGGGAADPGEFYFVIFGNM